MTNSDVLTFRESPLSLVFWIKLTVTVGLYFFWWRAKSVAITDTHVVCRQGVLSKNERSIPISHILDVEVHTGLLGRIFGYGDLQIHTAAYGSQSAAEVTLKRFGGASALKEAIARRQSRA